MSINRQPLLRFWNVFIWLIILFNSTTHLQASVIITSQWICFHMVFLNLLLNFQALTWNWRKRWRKKSAGKPCVTHMANQGKWPKLPILLSHSKWRCRRSINDKQQEFLDKSCTLTLLLVLPPRKMRRSVIFVINNHSLV